MCEYVSCVWCVCDGAVQSLIQVCSKTNRDLTQTHRQDSERATKDRKRTVAKVGQGRCDAGPRRVQGRKKANTRRYKGDTKPIPANDLGIVSGWQQSMKN